MNLTLFPLGAIACAAIVAAAQPPAAPQAPAGAQPPVFRSSAELVVVDVSVVDRDGAPVRTLRAEDFTVKVDGQPRRVASMQYVDPPATGTASPVPAARPAPTPRFSANDTGAAGRLVMFAVDEAGIRFGNLRAAVESIDRLLEGFGPTDRFAVATLVGPRIIVGFTSDRGRVVEALRREPGGGMVRRGPSPVQLTVTEAFDIVRADGMTTQDVLQRECDKYLRDPGAYKTCLNDVSDEARRIVIDSRNRSTDLAGSMRALLGWLRPIDAPKVVVLFSEGVPSQDAAQDVLPLGADAAAARAVIHVMKLDRWLPDASGRPLKEFAPSDIMSAGTILEVLAGVARGRVFDVAATADGAFRQLAREVSGYYLLGIEPVGNARDGNPHRIEVAVGQLGLTVRARPQYMFAAPITDETELLSAALRAPLPATGLPVRLTTFNLADEDPAKVRVMVSAEIDRQEAAGGQALVAFALLDGNALPVATFSRRVDLERTAGGALAFAAAVTVAPGAYTLKLATVRDGRAGSVERQVVARLSGTPPLAIGDLVMRAPPGSPPRLAPPVDGRVAGDRVGGFAQFAVDPADRSTIACVLEIARTDESPAVLAAPCAIEAVGSRTRAATAAVDARLLPPGDWAARLIVHVADRPAVRLAAPFTFDRAARRERPAAGAPAARPAGLAPFRPSDVLTPDVLGPFLDELVRRAPADARPAIDLARAGRLDEAARSAPAGRTGDPAAPLLRGLWLLSRGQVEPASEAFLAAADAAPGLVGAAFYAGVCHAAAGREAQAISAWENTLVSLDKYAAVYRALVDAEIRDGQWDRAADLLDEALSRWPDDAALGGRLEPVMLETGRYESAVDYADGVIEREPANTGVLALAMEAAFLLAADRADADVAALEARFARYRELYRLAGGAARPLADEWGRYLAARRR
jgi:VWFA-related protein